MRSDAWIGIAQLGEIGSVQLSRRGRMGRTQGQFIFLEHLLPRSLRVQRRAVKHRSRCGFLTGIGENVELLRCPLVLSGKAEQFEEKSAAPGVERLFPQLAT